MDERAPLIVAFRDSAHCPPDYEGDEIYINVQCVRLLTEGPDREDGSPRTNMTIEVGGKDSFLLVDGSLPEVLAKLRGET